MEHPIEFDNIRKVAAELLGRLPPRVLLSVLKYKCQLDMVENIRYSTLYVLVACNSIVAHELQSETLLEVIAPFIFKILSFSTRSEGKHFAVSHIHLD
jgi:hypothetical protein